MATRIRNEREVYESSPFNSSSGELDVWDSAIFPEVVRTRQYAFFRSFAVASEGGIKLDVGCGAGWTTHFFSQNGARTVGLDVSLKLLEGARKSHLAGEEYLLADGCELPLKDAAVETIVSASALHHLPVEQTLIEWSRVLQHGGRLVLLEPNALNPLAAIGRLFFATETHTPGERPFVPGRLKSLLESFGWTVVHWETQILFAFAVSRAFRVLRLPDRLARSLAPLIDHAERVFLHFPGASRLGWVIFCVARKVV